MAIEAIQPSHSGQSETKKEHKLNKMRVVLVLCLWKSNKGLAIEENNAMYGSLPAVELVNSKLKLFVDTVFFFQHILEA